MIELCESIQLDTGLQFGKGLFETLLVKDQHALHLDLHVDRLNTGLQKLGIHQQIAMSMVEDVTKRLGNFNNHHTYVLKILVTEKNKLALPRSYSYTESHFRHGLKLTISPILRNETSPAVYLKTLNYLDNLVARDTAKNAGFDDALFLNTQGFLTETSSANLFFIRENKIYTPSIQSGLLNGIYRQLIFQKFNIHEGFFTLDDLRHAEAVFITNSLLTVMPICQIDKQYYMTQDHPLFQSIFSFFYPFQSFKFASDHAK